MNRWIYVPVIVAQVSVAQVSAQQAVSAPSEAEKALRDRVQQFYQLQFEKKFRQAEAFVAEDTKDWYFASKKPDLQGFTVQKVEMLDGGTRAKVTVKTKSSMMMMGVGRLPVELPTETTWELENGNWVWYVDTKAPMPTPFGSMSTGLTPTGSAPPDVKSIIQAIDPDTLQSQLQSKVTIDRTDVTLSVSAPAATVIISNGMPGFVDLILPSEIIPGIGIKADKLKLGVGEQAHIRIEMTGKIERDSLVRISVSPLNFDLDVRVHTK